MIGRFLGRTDDGEEEPDDDEPEPPIEYCLIREDGEQQQLVESFQRAVGETFVEVDVNPTPGQYRLQERRTDKMQYGKVIWQTEIGNTEQHDRVDELEAELRGLRQELASEDENSGPSFTSGDVDALEGELLGALAHEVGPSEALDRLERLEVARSSGDLASSVDDPRDVGEVSGRVIIDAWERFGSDLSEILDGVSTLSSGSNQSLDAAALENAIEARADEMGIEPDAAGSRSAAVADGSGEDDEDLRKSAARRSMEGRFQDDEDDEEETGGSSLRRRLEGEVEEYVDEIDEEDEPDEGDEEDDGDD